jgi:hypothetical protein
MRAELLTAVADVLAGASPGGIELSQAETDSLLAAADLVTLTRTGVGFDYRREYGVCALADKSGTPRDSSRSSRPSVPRRTALLPNWKDNVHAFVQLDQDS